MYVQQQKDPDDDTGSAQDMTGFALCQSLVGCSGKVDLHLRRLIVNFFIIFLHITVCSKTVTWDGAFKGKGKYSVIVWQFQAKRESIITCTMLYELGSSDLERFNHWPTASHLL